MVYLQRMELVCKSGGLLHARFEVQAAFVPNWGGGDKLGGKTRKNHKMSFLTNQKAQQKSSAWTITSMAVLNPTTLIRRHNLPVSLYPSIENTRRRFSLILRVISSCNKKLTYEFVLTPSHHHLVNLLISTTPSGTHGIVIIYYSDYINRYINNIEGLILRSSPFLLGSRRHGIGCCVNLLSSLQFNDRHHLEPWHIF